MSSSLSSRRSKGILLRGAPPAPRPPRHSSAEQRMREHTVALPARARRFPIARLISDWLRAGRASSTSTSLQRFNVCSEGVPAMEKQQLIFVLILASIIEVSGSTRFAKSKPFTLTSGVCWTQLWAASVVCEKRNTNNGADNCKAPLALALGAKLCTGLTVVFHCLPERIWVGRRDWRHQPRPDAYVQPHHEVCPRHGKRDSRSARRCLPLRRLVLWHGCLHYGGTLCGRRV